MATIHVIEADIYIVDVLNTDTREKKKLIESIWIRNAR